MGDYSDLRKLERSYFVLHGPMLIRLRGADRQVRLWDIAQRTSVFTTQTAAPVWAFDWQPANVSSGSLGVGKQFAIGGDEKKVMIHRAAGSV
jgi:WD repeat-containing protein 61